MKAFDKNGTQIKNGTEVLFKGISYDIFIMYDGVQLSNELEELYISKDSYKYFQEHIEIKREFIK